MSLADRARATLARIQGADTAAAEREAAAERDHRAHEMGQRLRDKRLAANLTPADVERDTRINRQYIEAIEGARWEELPAPVYARGFTRSYARYLGLDPEEAAAAIPTDLPQPPGIEPMPGLRRSAPPVLPAVNMPVVVGIGAAAIVVIILAVFLPRLGGGPGLPGTTPGDTPVATQTTTPGTPTPTPGQPVEGIAVPPFDPGRAPDFTGVSRTEAQRVLTEIGATPLIVEAASTTPAGLIFDQSPAPGAPLGSGDVVTLFISRGE